MIFEEVVTIFQLVKGDKVVSTVAAVVTIFSVLLALTFSPLAALIIYTNYVLGFIICWSLIKYQKNASFCLQRLVSFYRGHISHSKADPNTCGICNDAFCDRHRTTKRNLPWKNLLVNKKLNASIEHFYDRLIEEFVASWYKNLTDDVAFLNEVRFSLKYATSSAARKILDVDAGALIANKLIPCAVKHIDDYLCMQQIAKLKNVEVNKIAIEYLGRKLHVATTNRDNELSYLRQLTSCLMPYLLPKEYLKCSNYSVLIREIFSGWVLLPMMDVLADPNMINSLVILIATYKPKGMTSAIEEIENVELLGSFVDRDVKYTSLATDLKTVLKSTELLYCLMQFLIKESSVHVLQFCLAVEHFNNKLILPDLSKRQLENLHTEALNLYKIYFDRKSTDFIGCSDDIVTELNELLAEGVYNVAKLRTSAPLFRAYDFAFEILENEWLPQFYHSNEFYSYLCGTKVTATYTKSAVNKSRKYYDAPSQGTVAKISSGLVKIKGALQTKQPVEGIYTPEFQVFDNDATQCVENVVSHSPCSRDFSAWRIAIPRVDARQLGSSKAVNIFNVSVRRIDKTSENDIRHWTVFRKDQDFYTLKAKLIEFHGEAAIPDSLLPSRRYLPSVESRRAKYEEFLGVLLQKAFLRSSDLLHTFLTTEEDFNCVINAGGASVDLENIYQSVAYKLRKEKGQHLDSFMNTFLASTGRIKQSKVEWAELGDEIDISSEIDKNTVIIPKTFKNKVFQNNFGVPYKEYEQSSSSAFNPNGITESLFYLLKHTFKVPHGVLKLYAAMCSVAQQAFDSMCRMLIEKKLRSGLSQSNLAYLIGLLEDVVFSKQKSATAQELEERKTRAFTELENLVPKYLVRILGADFKLGFIGLLDMLQNPLYNKQLVYNLMDIIMAEMFPLLDEHEDKKS